MTGHARLISRRHMLACAAASSLLAGCGAIAPRRHAEWRGGGPVPAGQVLLVGRIEVIPPIGATEQKIRIALDPADVRGTLHQRAMLFLADRPAGERDTSANYINPRLGEWFVCAVPRELRHVTEASIFMEYEPQMQGRRRSTVQSAQLLLPAPLALDVRDADKAVYVGTWKIWRDEFHQVTRVDVQVEAEAARRALRASAGADIDLRVAVPRELTAAQRR